MPSLVYIGPLVTEKLKIFSMLFFSLLSTPGKENGHFLNKFESTSFKDALCQVKLKLAHKILKILSIYFFILPWERK